jgi:dolichyl-phosphate beta-glucosyltransferase
MDPLLSVVIPAYNEQGRLGLTLQKISSYLTAAGHVFEIIVIDDHSEDATGQVVADFGRSHPVEGAVRLLSNSENRGKGFSIRRGMLAASGAFALMTDADLSTPIEELEKLEQSVIDGKGDIAFGSRDVEGSVVAVRQSWFRENSGKIFNRMVRVITGLPYRDTQCGFKLFRMSSCRAIFEVQQIDNFSFDVELLFIARKWGLVVKEVPVVWRHSPGSKVRFLTDAPRMFAGLLRIRRLESQGCYSLPGDVRSELRNAMKKTNS